MVKTLIVTLADDLDGTEADETVIFALDSNTYEIDLNKKHASELRSFLRRYIDAGRSAGQSGRRVQSSASGATPTLFSQLDREQKERFRAWAKLPDARRIRDSRVREWIDAGRP